MLISDAPGARDVVTGGGGARFAISDFRDRCWDSNAASRTSVPVPYNIWRMISGECALAERLPMPGVQSREGMGVGNEGLHLREYAACASRPRSLRDHMHGSKLPLTAWFWAAYLLATHSDGISACNSATNSASALTSRRWLLCAKLRRGHRRAGLLDQAGPRRGQRDGDPLAHQVSG